MDEKGATINTAISADVKKLADNNFICVIFLFSLQSNVKKTFKVDNWLYFYFFEFVTDFV